MRPETKIGAKDVAVLGAMLQEVDQRARDAHGRRHRAVLAAWTKAFGIEQDDQVDIAGVVELERAELAHAEHDQAGGRPGIIRVLQQQIAFFAELAKRKAEGVADRGVGKTAERFGYFGEWPDPADVGEGDQERHPLPHASEMGHQGRAPPVRRA